MAPRAAKVRLTPAGIDRLKPAEPGRRYIVWDDVKAHFGIRVTDGGAKSFIVVARKAGQNHPHFHVIGRWPDWSIKDARDQVDAIIAQLRQGKNPKHEAKKSAEDTFEKAACVFLVFKQRRMRPTPFYQLEGDLRRGFMGQHRKRIWNKDLRRWTSEWVQERDDHFRRMPVLQINYSDIRRRLREIEAKEGKYAARHAMSAIRSFFKWCHKEEEFGFRYDTPSPVMRLDNDLIEFEADELERERVLDDDELRQVWAATKDIGSPAGELFRILLLTGQRKNDWAMAERKEWDRQLEVLAISKARYKTKVDHLVPLGPKAVEILEALPTHPRFLFSTDGERPVTGLGWFKSKLDKAIEARRGAPMEPWVIHDLRRTVRTRLSDLGIDILIGELVLGHAPPRIRRNYDRSAHLDRKRTALEAWQNRLLEIVGEGPKDNVIKLPNRKRRAA